MTKDSKVRTLAGLAAARWSSGTVAIGVTYAQRPAGRERRRRSAATA